MSLKSLLKRFGLAIGLLEVSPRSAHDEKIIFVVDKDDTFEGALSTTHDVLVQGLVRGAIISPHKTVEIAQGGCVVGSLIQADTVVWRGELGGVKVVCRTLIIEASASNTQGMRSPGVSYERLHINDCINTAVRLTYARYQDSMEMEPFIEPANTAKPAPIGGTVVALESAAKARHNGGSFISQQA